MPETVNVVRVKPGVEFTVIAPGGMRMLAALVIVAMRLSLDLTVTSACDGEHSGIDDPHHRGEAYDVRTHTLNDPQAVLTALQSELGLRFYAFLEDPGTDNEHLHMQAAKGTNYPPEAA